MPSFESVALELLQYKVDDLLQGRVTRGGPAAAWELLDRLNRSASLMSEEDRRRLTVLSRQLRTVGETPKDQKESSLSFDSLVLGGVQEPAGADSYVTVSTCEGQAVRLRRAW